MINQGINVPEKTIALFSNQTTDYLSPKDKKRISGLIEKSGKKRDWFTPHFYKCLPLSIGNQYGFIIKNEFDLGFIWDGGDSKESTTLLFTETKENLSKKYSRVESHFGHGIITINPPYWLRTPPGVNLMTINPPNHIIPNITVLTGVIETDNIRRNFTFNIKIQIPNIQVIIPAGTPLAAFIPVPRNYCDSFKLEHAENIFSEELIDEEMQAETDAQLHRLEVEPTLKGEWGKHYLLGEDVYGNKFPDHQKS